jgi:hypothetical protein
LLLIPATGAAVALLSGLTHYLLARQLVDEAVGQQMRTALHAAESAFQRTYVIPLMSELRLLDEDGVERLGVQDGRRLRRCLALGHDIAGDSLNSALDSLHRRLATSPPGTVLVEGPLFEVGEPQVREGRPRVRAAP